MSDVLATFLEQAAAGGADRLSRAVMDEMGVECELLPFLRTTTPPQIITCPGCEEACQMRHQRVDGKPFIWCDAPPALGRIDLQPHDLEHWRLDMPALAQWLADALELPPSREIILAQAFEIGVLEGQTLFLIAGNNPEVWMDARIRNMQPLLLTLVPLPESLTLPSLWLGQLLRLDATGLILLRERLYQALQRQQPAQGNIFRRKGDYWLVRYEGKEAMIKHSNGMVYLDHLLHRPNEEVPALVLQGLTNKAVLDALPVDEEYSESASLGGDALIDKEAIEATKAALEKLKKRNPDSPQITELEDFLKRAAYKGKSRNFVDDNERARSSVTQAIGEARKRLKKHLPELEQHLGVVLTTGRYCQYVAGEDWHWK